MDNSAKSRILVCLGLGLIITFVGLASAQAGLFDIFKIFKGHKSKQTAVPKQSLLVFPFDQAEGMNVPDNYGSEIVAYLRTMLAGNPKYAVFLFSEKLSPIRRGKEDTSLKTEGLKPPFSEGGPNALVLARLCAADFYLVGSVDAFDYDAAAKVAQMTLSCELVNGKTGKSLGTYVVTGKADESSKASGEDEYRAVAAGKAVDALKGQMLPDPKPEAQEAKAPAPEAADSASPPPAEPGK